MGSIVWLGTHVNAGDVLMRLLDKYDKLEDDNNLECFLLIALLGLDRKPTN